MSDNVLRCVLVYRLENKSGGDDNIADDGVSMTSMSLSPGAGVSVTMLAKYDHASQYESHGGASDPGSLYGGRDKSYSDAVGLVVSGNPPGAVNSDATIGGFNVVQSTVHQVVYGADMDGLCLAVITGQKYPSRVAIQMLTELYGQFSQNFGLQAKSATTNSLTKKSKPMLSSICKKYSDLNNVDKASALIDKVDQVKISMQDNIAVMLKNTEQAETLADKSEQLNEQATVFKKKSTDLKKQMKCKNLKMTIILGLLIFGILAVILVPLILKATKKD
uniref:V-SNARE coiled-coil homology domain-containing protein n=2 Tax=Ditylum brightwellii TaxID=49249 RepID=A0A6V2A733_9STRA|mmetsp:Transcript_21925/g.32294  ORF Transcript_21925/g.32294 Transcript_21925/m.32294 type:complete len:277 (+) Transcript_21925:72-902(+)